MIKTASAYPHGQTEVKQTQRLQFTDATDLCPIKMVGSEFGDIILDRFKNTPDGREAKINIWNRQPLNED